MISVPIMIDFSSSSFTLEGFPIEVGFSGRHGEGWCSLIRPEQDWTCWDNEAARVHRIPKEIVRQRGSSTQEIANKLNHYLRGKSVFCEEWELDCLSLEKIFVTAKLEPQFQLRDLNEITNSDQVSLWDITKEKVIKELCLERRRASGEARVLQLTWLRTYDAVKKTSSKLNLPILRSAV